MEATNLGHVRVAIVGSGMAGLVTAFLLNQDRKHRYQVTVFEAGAEPSLDSASCSVKNPLTEKSERVDLPMRAFAGGYYRNLQAMYDYLGVAYHQQRFLFLFSNVFQSAGQPSLENQGHPYFIHASNNHQIPPPRPCNVNVLNHAITITYVFICYAWFSICCFFFKPKRAGTTDEYETIREYLSRIRLPSHFISLFLLPLISSVTTCSHDALLDFPATDLTEYKRLTHNMNHFTVMNGVQNVQRRLTKDIKILLSSRVVSVEPVGEKAVLSWMNTTKLEERSEIMTDTFDKVIMAVAPDVVGKLFNPLKSHMDRIPTIMIESIVHTDMSTVTGIDDRVTAKQSHSKSNSSSQTIIVRTKDHDTALSESIHIQPSGVLVTTCPFTKINAGTIIKSTKFTRVLRTPESRRIVNRIFSTGNDHSWEKHSSWRNGDDNIFLVGGWCWDGMVLLEGCIVSATNVARMLDVDIPWLKASAR